MVYARVVSAQYMERLHVEQRERMLLHYVYEGVAAYVFEPLTRQHMAAYGSATGCTDRLAIGDVLSADWATAALYKIGRSIS